MSCQTLISTADLQARLADPALVVIDCRHDLAKPAWGRAGYERAHIPGARFLHLDEDLSTKPNGRSGRHPLPEPAVFARRLGRAGIGNVSEVIAYDSQGGHGRVAVEELVKRIVATRCGFHTAHVSFLVARLSPVIFALSSTACAHFATYLSYIVGSMGSRLK